MIDALMSSDLIADAAKAALIGLAVGMLFGAAAERSGFCLRAATEEFWTAHVGLRFATWLAVFGAALAGTQALLAGALLDPDNVRQLTNPGSLSGAVIGGLLFGSGMVLARGCASRLLVLSATGNMRALVAGLVLTVVAQASLTGALSPLRDTLAGLWIVQPETRDLSARLFPHAGLLAGLAFLAAAVFLFRRCKADAGTGVAALLVGAAVVLGWAATARLADIAFDPVPVESITFTGPSADTLMALIGRPDLPLNFGIGLVPGVFAGSGLSALAGGRFRLRAFSAETGTARYLMGAALMGFGGMLAGGCAVGAGITGGSVLSLTAWIALAAMWGAAGATHWLLRAGQTDGARTSEPKTPLAGKTR
ncbi:MAG: YeeE/YedE family protein [Pseudomonadota bacterium]